MKFKEFVSNLPEEITINREMLLKVCKAANVEVPFSEKFYLKKHTPRASKTNEYPMEVEFVVVPHPYSRRELWIRRGDYADFISAAIEFKQKIGL